MSERARPVGGSFWGDVDDTEALEGYETLVNEVDDGIYQLDAEGRFVGVNDMIVETTGYTREDLLGEHVSLVLNESDIERIRRDFLERLQTGALNEVTTYETTIETATSELLSCDLRISLLISDGEFRGSVGIVRDITERKRRERHLESELDEVLGRISDAFYAVDTEWRFTHVNEQFEELVGMSEDELLGENIWDRLPEIVDTTIYETATRAMETGEPVSYEGYSEPWNTWFENHVYPSETGLSVYVRDITERKEMERGLRESEEKFRQLAEHLDQVVWMTTGDQREVLYLNPAFENVWGIDRERVYDDIEALIETVHPDDRERVSEEFTKQVHDEYEVEYRIVRPDGEVRWIHDRATPIYDNDGNVYRIVGDANDITERKEREQRLEELVTMLEESNERLEQFAYAASHDLQEPLRMVSNYLQLLERRYAADLDSDAEEFIAFAVDGAERMRDMIDGLLEYSRVETQGEPFAPVDLDDVLDDVRTDLQFQIEESDAEIKTDSLPRVHGDSGQLRQVFQNLLINAIEYSGDEPPRIHISTTREGAEWRICVRDEGIGIDPDDVDRVFEVFQRLHSRDQHEGTGIGLALCQRIVERHDGEIWVESEPDDGSTFSLTLPATDT